MGKLTKTEYTIEAEATIRNSSNFIDQEQLENATALLLILPSWAYFAIEHNLTTMIDKRGIAKVFFSFARSEIDGVYKLFALMYATDIKDLGRAAEVIKEVIPHTAMRVTTVSVPP